MIGDLLFQLSYVIRFFLIRMCHSWLAWDNCQSRSFSGFLQILIQLLHVLDYMHVRLCDTGYQILQTSTPSKSKAIRTDTVMGSSSCFWVLSCPDSPLLYIYLSCSPYRIQIPGSNTKTTAVERIFNHLLQLCTVKFL